MVERLNIGEAANALSDRIRAEGGGLTPEFENPSGTAEEVEAPEPSTEDAGASEEATLEPEPETGAEGEDEERFELPGSIVKPLCICEQARIDHA